MPIHKARGNGESAQQASLGARLCQLAPPKSRLSWRPTRPHQEIEHVLSSTERDISARLPARGNRPIRSNGREARTGL
ncbi:hypothetical protein F2Q68_00010445 [Brassica cretica]|uniref:Uncharacterized protein n=1 Tax=Brassica cretica TaxID=69181 RepID=A0A8S9KXS1_BRACR|nr:hypothetical protein F2Q68_00010445 [Brassica cretica]